MDTTQNRFKKAEDALIYKGFKEGLSDTEIVTALAINGFFRSWAAIYSRRRTLGYMHEQSKKHKPIPVNWAPAKFGDEKFKLAMIRAFKSGSETGILGVVKDKRPFAIGTIQAEPPGSGCGCALA